jgi:hypothetical protein
MSERYPQRHCVGLSEGSLAGLEAARHHFNLVSEASK